MIQQLKKADKKGGLFTFILFTPKQSQVKDPKKIKDRTIKNATTSNTNFQLFNINRPKHSSFFAQITILAETIFSNTEFILEFDTEAEDNKKGKINDSKLLFALLATKSEITNQIKAAKKQKNQSELQKRANLPDKFFDYIYYVFCQRFFSLAWYNDITYAINKATKLRKNLPTLCCNGPSCKSTEPKFLQREPFIEIFLIKYLEID